MKNYLLPIGLFSLAISMGASALTVTHDNTSSTAALYVLTSTDISHQTESLMQQLPFDANQEHPVEMTANVYLESLSKSGFLIIGPSNPEYNINYFRDMAKDYPGSVPSNLCNLTTSDINRTIHITKTGCTVVS